MQRFSKLFGVDHPFGMALVQHSLEGKMKL